MIKQIQIFVADTPINLQDKINNFCIDFFPEEIISIKIIRNLNEQEKEEKWLGYIVYQKDEYQDASINDS